MRKNCLRHLEDVQALLMISYEEHKPQKLQTPEDPVQHTSQAANTDIRITNFALNQTLFPDGNTDVDTEIQRRTVSLKSKEIRILIAGQYAFFCRGFLCWLLLISVGVLLVNAPDEGKPSKNHFGWPPV